MPRYVLLGAVALVLCLPAWASKKDDDYKAAQAAAAAGQYENAMKLYCAVAKEDANYKDAKQNCENIRTELLKEEGRNEGRFSDGVKAFDAGDYDQAEQKLRNIRSARERVWQVLLLAAGENARTVTFDRPLKVIAGEAGLTHEAFYRALSKLSQAGRIRRRGRCIDLMA